MITSLLFFANVALAVEQPKLTKAADASQVDVVEYANGEAWEVVPDWSQALYLNYNKAPWGESALDGQLVRVCYEIVNGRKIFGIALSDERIVAAMDTVINDRLSHVDRQLQACENLSDVLSKDPRNKDVSYFGNSIH